MLYHKYKPLASRVYCTGLALLLVLSGVQLQRTGYAAGFQPHHAAGADWVRRAASGRKNYPADQIYEARWQKVLIAVIAGLHGVFVVVWRRSVVLLAALIGLGPRCGLGRPPCASTSSRRWPGWCWCKRYFATPLMPYKFYCRNWDFGYGHYTALVRGLSACFAWAWLRHDRLRAFDWAGAGRAGDLHLQGSRQPRGVWRHGGAVCAVLCPKFLPKLFDSRIFYGLALALPVALAVFSLYAGYVYNPEWPYERMALLLLSIALSGRLRIWHNVFWSAPLSLLGPAHRW